jgi:hypothetical protein
MSIDTLNICSNIFHYKALQNFSKLRLEKLSPRSELWSLGVKLSPVGEIICLPSILLNNRECLPLGVNEGVNIPPMEQISPAGAKFTLREEVHP